MMGEYGASTGVRRSRAVRIFGYVAVLCVLGACAAWPKGRASEDSVPRSTLSPEESSDQIDQILAQKPGTQESEEGAEKVPDDAALDSADSCLREVMIGLLQCHAPMLDAIDADKLDEIPDCVPFFQRAIERVQTEADAVAVGLGTAMVELRAPPEGIVSELRNPGRALGCMASAVLWRSLFQPEDLDSARSVPAALEIIEGMPSEYARALFGLPFWSRAVYLSQAPSEFGGALPKAASDLDTSLSMAGPLQAYVHALRLRYLCTARQDPQCAEAAEATFRSTPATPEVYQAANRLVGWVRARYYLLFPTAPFTRELNPPVESEREDTPALDHEGADG